MPQNDGFGGFDPVNRQLYQQNPQKAHLCVERRQNQSKSATCACDKGTKKDKENKLTVTNWVFAQSTHVIGSKYHLASWVVFQQ